jgi:lysophospholipid acyltransferase (LPLAT)-like uncharacterized protein
MVPHPDGRADGLRRPEAAHSPGVRAPIEQATIRVAGAAVLALAGMMARLTQVGFVGREEVLSVKAAGRRIVFVSWHGSDLCNLALYPQLCGRESRAVIMAPIPTRTGRIMEQVAGGLGYEVVPIGTESTSPESARAVVKMVSRIKDGCDAMIAVDGPSGPPEEVKLGAAVIAKRASAVIVPTVVAGSRELRIRSRWDKHLLIPPFARMVFHLGPLIDTRPAEDVAPSEGEIRDRIDAALRRGAVRARAIADAAADVPA